MRNIFGKKKSATSSFNNLVDSIRDSVGNSQMVSGQVARYALSTESLTEDKQHALITVANELQISLEAIANNLGIERQISAAQYEAAVAGGVLAGDCQSTLSRKLDVSSISTESMGVVTYTHGGDSFENRAVSLEAYDERENRNAVIYSIAYNMQAARQDEFGETHFPTITMAPNEVGFGITVNLMMVYKGIERHISGTFEDFKKRNIIRAVTDSSILHKDQTRAVPVHRAQAADKFVDSAIVAPYSVMLDDQPVLTAPIVIGKKFDLLGLSQPDALLSAGTMDMTDTLDPYINLQAVYVKVGADVLRFNTLNLPTSNFTYSTQKNYRVMTLNFETTSVLINKNTKNVDGSALADLADVVTSDLIVRLEMMLTGTVNIETGETVVYANALQVYSVQDAVGNMLDLTSGVAATVTAALKTGAVVGYDIQAYRTNANVRQRGQFIDVTKYQQLYNVPLRSPYSTIHPINVDGQTDASDVQSLVVATRIATSNTAVTTLLNTAQMLREYVDARDVIGVGPDILGVGRFFIRPTYYEENVDMTKSINSIKSHEVAADIQAVLVNKLRDYAYRMYRDSEYKAAFEVISGGVAPVPVVVIGTDPVIARYLTVTGDLRTLGGEFDVRIVSTNDARVAGKIFVTFGVFDENRNVAPHPLNFGNMVWASEVVVTANISRNGQISKETIVQPRYSHVVHCPVMAVLTVENIPSVLNKIAIHNHPV